MSERSYFVYIMASRSHTLHLGVTARLRARAFQHKWREFEGFSARYNCDRLVRFEEFHEVDSAIAREKEPKGWRREKKIAPIETSNPTWINPARDWFDVEPADLLRALE